MRHLIDPLDFTLEETTKVLDLADRIAESPEVYSHVADGKKIATLFYEPSTRTRLSFESAMLSLGGKSLGFAGAEPVSYTHLLLHTFFFQTANTAVHDSAYHSYFQSVPSQCLYGQNHRSEENIRYPFHNFTNHIYYGLCYKHESNQVQYRNVLSVKILAKISPSGSDAMIRSAAANQDAETDKDMTPRL